MIKGRRSFLEALLGGAAAILAGPYIPLPKPVKHWFCPAFRLNSLPLPITHTPFVFGMAQLSKARSIADNKAIDEFFRDHPIRFTVDDKPPVNKDVVVFRDGCFGR